MHSTPAHDAPHTSACAAPSGMSRLVWMAVNALVFQLAYSVCNAAAQRVQVTRHVATAWDAQLPFVAWMILPYLSSVPLLMLGFAVAVDRQALRTYSQRLLLTSVLGCLVFALWPLVFHGLRPQPAEAPWATLYGLLHALDGPFNQWPSLHVAFMVVLWPTLSAALPSTAARGLARGLLALGLLIVAASTVFTHQHHLADVAGGLLLGALACRLVPAQRPQTERPAVALHYGVASILAVVLGLTLGPWWLRLLWAWLAVCTAAVAWAYRCGNAQFLHKRGGRFPAWVWLLYGPYLAGYVATWWLVRWRERHQPPAQPCGPLLWVGRRLSAAEAAALLPPHCTVIDLANELTETAALRADHRHGPGRRYHAVALLDLQPVPAAAQAHVMQLMQHEHAQGRTVFLHCAMGYSRSRELAQAYLQHQTDIDLRPHCP
ncbi:MAG: phosphatase PAP2 family protein [Burkholderiales bacterium]